MALKNRMPRPVRTLVLGALLVLGVLGVPASHALDISEAQLKAVYLYNFVKYITWAESTFSSANEPISVCLFKAENIETHLAEAVSKKIAGHSIKVVNLSSEKDMQGCKLSYFAGADILAVKACEQNIPAGMVCVSDENESVAISFSRVGNKLGFVVNLEKLNLKLVTPSSDLLKIAERVIGK